MKTVQEIMERIEVETQLEFDLRKSAIRRNDFTSASMANTRLILLEQLRDWIQSPVDSDAKEEGC